MKSKQNIFGITVFAIACCLVLAHTLKLINISLPVILGFALILYSIPSLYISVDRSDRLRIVLYTFLFFTGVVLIIVKLFDLLDPLKVVFPSIIFVTGIIFILLYIENTDEKAFLYAGIFSAAAGILSVLLYRHFAFFYYTDKIIYFLSGYWHIILIVSGIVLLLNRNRK